MANTVLAGDYSGLISFKGDKKGLLKTTTNWSCRRAIPAWAAV